MILNLKDKRKAKRMTQTEVAEMCGIKRVRYWTYETGKRHPKPELAMKIAQVLEFDWKDFYEEPNEEGRI